MVLRKPGKKDYGSPRAYRPISLLPTISKGLESIVAARLSYMAERYNLLPNNHFGARKHRSSEQALNVLAECIHQAWRTDKVLSLVTFDVQGAFNGVHLMCGEQKLRHILPLSCGRCLGNKLSSDTDALVTIGNP